jgi:hypothetical protein
VTPADPYSEHDARFTKSDGGQNKNGSYSDEGKKIFAETLADIKKSRKENKEAIKNLEKLAVEKIRLAHKLKESTSNKRKKEAGDGPATKKTKYALDESDDEDLSDEEEIDYGSENEGSVTDNSTAGS